MPVNRNTVTVTGQAGSANAITTTQAGVAGTALTINGALATTGQPVPSNASTISVPPDYPALNLPSVLNAGRGEPATGTAALLGPAQPIIITSAGNDSANSFTIVGLGPSGESITEVLPGANGVATSVNFFTVIYSVTPKSNTAANVTVGTTAVVYSPWLIVGSQRNDFQSQIRTFISGTVNYDIQATTDPHLMAKSGGQCDDLITEIAAQTGAVSSFPNAPMVAYRIKMNSGTGTVNLRAVLTRTA